jgi:hypothetical protein
MQDNVVWTSTLDGRYEVTVTRTDDYHCATSWLKSAGP